MVRPCLQGERTTFKLKRVLAKLSRWYHLLRKLLPIANSFDAFPFSLQAKRLGTMRWCPSSPRGREGAPRPSLPGASAAPSTRALPCGPRWARRRPLPGARPARPARSSRWPRGRGEGPPRGSPRWAPPGPPRAGPGPGWTGCPAHTTTRNER